MKKLFASFFIFVFTLTLALCLVGCAKQCTYRFVNENGTVLSEGTGKKGSTIVAPANPTKASTDEFSYEFIGWDKEVGKLESDITFIAQYKEVKRKYTVKFLNHDESVLKEESVEYGSLPTAPATPTKADTDEFSYEFVGWDKEVVAVTGDVTYTAKFEQTKRKYTYKFVNFDGSILKEDKVDYGTLPNIPANPEKSGTAEFSYEFIGWDKEVVEVTGDVVYTAQYREVKRQYTYKFVNFDGKVLKSETVDYGTLPTAPTNPSRPATKEFTYTFSGWDKEIVAVTGDVVYTAQYTSTKNKYTYKFVDFDGTILSEEEVEYGTLPTAPEDPTRPEDEKRTYEFIGWDKEIAPVTGDVVYTAVYQSTVKEIKYTELAGKRISILGDSISTFYQDGSPMNSYYGQVGRFYYPTYCQDVRTVDKTWWGQLINNTNMILGVNNSWSGSTAIGTDESAGCSDARINTLIQNGNPDIVILYLGTNDLCSGFSVESFVAAYEMILSKIYNLCATQVYVCTLGYTEYTGMKYTEEGRIAYNKAIRAFAEKHNLGVIPLDEYVQEDNYKLYLNDYLHYKYKGTTLLSQIF